MVLVALAEPGAPVACCAGVRLAATVASESAVSAIRRAPAANRLLIVPLLLKDTKRLSMAVNSFRSPNNLNWTLAIVRARLEIIEMAFRG